jgi:hypothetical protein
MTTQFSNNRWGSESEQSVMYRLHGKKALIKNLSNSEKDCYEKLAVGMVVTIDHQYSPENTDLYVADDSGELIGRVSRENLVIESVDRTKPNNDNTRGYLIVLIKKAHQLKITVCLGSNSRNGKLVYHTIIGKKSVLDYLASHS